MPDYDDALVEAAAAKIDEAGFAWKAANGGDDATWADIPSEVFARAAIAAVLEWQGKQPTITIPVCVPHNVRLAIARSIGKSIDETNHMVRADLAYHAMLDAYRLAP